MYNAKEVLVTLWMSGKISSEDLEKEIAYHLDMCRIKNA